MYLLARSQELLGGALCSETMMVMWSVLGEGKRTDHAVNQAWVKGLLQVASQLGMVRLMSSLKWIL
jgi:hypothetical protein